MTIKELHEATPATQELYISENGSVSPLDRNSVLTLSAYGDLVIAAIEARGHDQIEITVKMQPVKEKG
jgi:hypothetical protein